MGDRLNRQSGKLNVLIAIDQKRCGGGIEARHKLDLAIQEAVHHETPCLGDESALAVFLGHAAAGCDKHGEDSVVVRAIDPQ
ncbi:hypothetical protein D3C87_2095010 [compost metagenome]